MANENKKETYYSMDFYLGSGCDKDRSEINNVSLRSKKLENLAKKLNFISNFRKNVFDVTVFECKNSYVVGLIYVATIEEIENWFKGRGIEL